MSDEFDGSAVLRAMSGSRLLGRLSEHTPKTAARMLLTALVIVLAEMEEDEANITIERCKTNLAKTVDALRKDYAEKGLSRIWEKKA